MNLKVKRLHPEAKLPCYAHEGDAGLDLFTIEQFKLLPGCIYRIRTGIAIEIPSGYVGLIKEKSGLALDGVKLSGGVIDSGYRGEIIIIASFILSNFHYYIGNGAKIAQLLIQKVEQGQVTEVKELSSSDRGEKGFGSSGKQ